MKKNNNLLYGLGGVILGLICMKWMKEDVFEVLGLFDVTGKTFGIVFLVFGGWHLLVEIAENDELANLLESIIRLPFRILGWLLKHWYLVLAVVLVLNWKSVKEEEPVIVETAATEATEKIDPYFVQQPYPGMHRNAGSCKNLTRDAQVLLAFVNDNESSWTQEEMNQFVAELVDPALGYIEYYAEQYGHTISLESCAYFDEAGNYQVLQFDGVLRDGADGMGLVTIMDFELLGSETHGYSTTQEWLEDLRAYAGTDQVAVMFCVDKPGRSFACSESNRAEALECAVVYTSWKEQRSRARVFAHELMHLFGAEDLYAEGDKRVNRAALASQLHPNELHLKEQWNLYDHVVCGYNAYAVGWLDALPAEYDCPEWWS